MAPSETSSSKTLTFDRGHEIARAYSGERDQGMILSEFCQNTSPQSLMEQGFQPLKNV
jgi:hypothetical protein